MLYLPVPAIPRSTEIFCQSDLGVASLTETSVKKASRLQGATIDFASDIFSNHEKTDPCANIVDDMDKLLEIYSSSRTTY